MWRPGERSQIVWEKMCKAPEVGINLASPKSNEEAGVVRIDWTTGEREKGTSGSEPEWDHITRFGFLNTGITQSICFGFFLNPREPGSNMETKTVVGDGYLKNKII